jgi:hypothetical protein
LARVAVVAAGCLGSNQLPLALLDAGNSFAHFLPLGLQTGVCISSEHIVPMAANNPAKLLRATEVAAQWLTFLQCG